MAKTSPPTAAVRGPTKFVNRDKVVAKSGQRFREVSFELSEIPDLGADACWTQYLDFCFDAIEAPQNMTSSGRPHRSPLAFPDLSE